MADHRANGTPVGLLVCDVNGLKRVNDHHGHEAGDRLLRDLAGILRRDAARACCQVRSSLGSVATSSPSWWRVVRRTTWSPSPRSSACRPGDGCRTVSRWEWRAPATRSAPIDNEERLFRLADAAQYRAKRTGSRRPVVAGRALPVEAVVLAGRRAVASTAQDRRLRRGATSTPQPLQLLDAALRALDEAARASRRRCGWAWSRTWSVTTWTPSDGGCRAWRAGETEVTTVDYAIYRALPGLTPEELRDRGRGPLPGRPVPLDRPGAAGRRLHGQGRRSGGRRRRAGDPRRPVGRRRRGRRRAGPATGRPLARRGLHRRPERVRARPGHLAAGAGGHRPESTLTPGSASAGDRGGLPRSSTGPTRADSQVSGGIGCR